MAADRKEVVGVVSVVNCLFNQIQFNYHTTQTFAYQEHHDVCGRNTATQHWHWH
jgi:hypothetical protein